jgi:hypothetical protein
MSIFFILHIFLFYKKSVSRLLSAETRWRTCEEAFAATAGPKRREALATELDMENLIQDFILSFFAKKKPLPSMLDNGRFFLKCSYQLF